MLQCGSPWLLQLQLLLPPLSATFHSPLTSHTHSYPRNPSISTPNYSLLLPSHSHFTISPSLHFPSKTLKNPFNAKPSKNQSRMRHIQTNPPDSLWETCLTHCSLPSWLSGSERLAMLYPWRFVNFVSFFF